jgi:fluoroquinolone resistance protein
VAAEIGLFEEDDYQARAFSGVDADSMVVRGVRFDTCTFARSSFHATRFEACVFDDCVFTDCALPLVSVPECLFSATRFEDCKLTGVIWSDADWSSRAVVEPFSFWRCALDLSVFQGVRLDGVRFRDCSLREVDFSAAGLREADFSGSDLGSARFSGSDLRGARLEGAHSYAIDGGDNRIAGMRVSLPEAVSLLSSLGVELVESPPTP